MLGVGTSAKAQARSSRYITVWTGPAFCSLGKGLAGAKRHRCRSFPCIYKKRTTLSPHQAKANTLAVTQLKGAQVL
jgi:hypothetical protein